MKKVVVAGIGLVVALGLGAGIFFALHHSTNTKQVPESDDNLQTLYTQAQAMGSKAFSPLSSSSSAEKPTDNSSQPTAGNPVTSLQPAGNATTDSPTSTPNPSLGSGSTQSREGGETPGENCHPKPGFMCPLNAAD